MPDRIITICYRKIIDANTIKAWDKLVFDNSYLEFRMQAQTLSTGTDISSYSGLLQKFPGAKNLASMVAPAITGYIQQLDNVIPDLLNNIGKRFLKFDSFIFEIINSDINDKAKHQVAINFFSEPLRWHDTVGNHLLVSGINAEEDSTYSTNLYQLQPYVNINTIKTQ